MALKKGGGIFLLLWILNPHFMNEPKKLFLLDAMALIYRAYFALSRNPRINSKGQNTSAVLGFANALLDILKNQHPSHIGVAFDTHAPTVRHDDFEAYKANREKMPEDLAASIPIIKELIRGFNIPILEVDGYEADDVIGTLAKQAEKQGFITYMMTPDKDFGQLVSPHIFMYKPARMGNDAEVWGEKEVCARYQLENPKQMIDLLGLWGDASDNIPGVPGVGEKTAIKLIAEFGSMENLLENTDKLKGKLRENLENFKEQALQSKSLATIILDVPIEFDPDKLLMEMPNLEILTKLFDELEFRNYAQRFAALYAPKIEESTQGDLFSMEEMTPSMQDIKSTKHSYHLVENKEDIENLVKLLSQQKEFCFDTETTGVDANNAELVGMSFAVVPHEAWYVPVSENYNEALETVSLFKEVLEDPTIVKIGQNIKYDAAILNWYEVKVAGKLFDTMIAHYLLQPDMRHNMDVLSETYLNYRPVSITSLIGKKGKSQGSMRDLSPKEVYEYAAEDADVTLQLKEVFAPMLDEADTKKLFDEIEMPLIPVLASMEAEGVKLDVHTLNQFSLELETQINITQTDIFELAGEEFNVGSPKQLGIILFEKLAILDKPKKTKTGQYKTGEDELVKLAHRHPIIEKILEYRSLTKLKSTYVDALPALVNPRDGRIHTSYNQAVAATGRLSSNNPNLQNIPIRTELGREIRKAFIPRNSDYVLLAADYSQIELRIIAHLSGDKAMIQDFNEGVDIHTATASRIYNVSIGEVTRDMRRNAKTTNFGIIYGISAFGLSERLGIPRREAADIINSYFEKYAGVKKFMDTTIELAKQRGYVETIMGRRRYLNDINSGNAVMRGFAERNAINAPIQGSSADMIKLAMIKIYNEINQRNLRSKMILQVHDELVFDVHRDELEIIKPIIQKGMKEAMTLKVPVVVDMNTGENWLEAH